MEDLKKRNIRWGIIGLGKIANKFAQDLASIPDAELYAVGSRNQTRANKFAEKFQAVKAYDSYADLAKDINIDAVYIATPHSFHKENAILCLEQKKAVLCEKPMAMNAEELAEMIAIAQENNVLLMEAMWTYFLPHYQYVLTLIKNEKFGKITKLEADFGFKPEMDLSSRVFKKSLGGGSLLDIGIYPIFAALSSLGNPETIKASAFFFENGTDSQCEMIFEYAQQTAFLKSSFIENTATEAIFTCERGIIRINTRFHMPTTVSLFENGKEEIIDFDYKTIGYNFETIHFNELLRSGKKESDLMSFEFSKNLIQKLDEVRSHIGLAYE